MTKLDFIIVVCYVVGLLIFGMWTGMRETAEDFLVVSRRASFLLVLASIVSSWVGVGTTVVTAASAYDKGISLGLTGATGGLVGILVAGLMAPRIKRFGDRFQAHTIGDFFGLRYGAASRYLSTALIIVVYVLLCAAQFVGMTRLLEVWTGAPFRYIVLFAAVTTIIYTAFAGIKSDFYTDGIHFSVTTTVLFFILLPRSLHAAGGFASLAALPSSVWDPFAYGGVSFFVAGLAFGVAGVFVTMEIWQRIFAATSSSVARRALISAGAIILGFYSLSTVLGLLARILIPSLPVRDHALFALMGKVLPTGFLGLGLAAFLAIFISTVNTMMMVASASVTKDLYVSWWRPAATGSEILRAGRVSTLFVGAIAYVLAVWIHDLVVLSVNSLFVLLVLVPGIIGGFFWRRSTARAAVLSIVLGLSVVAALTPRFPNEAFAPGFVVSAIVFVATSLLTSHDVGERLDIADDKGGSLS
ncbi:MAG TPA: hypothetical protein VLC46_11970 [Thermoanaerobaculia bacterium]|jgi:SSS family solute:Na+ symporter|nr:hypothetical protein [Thermoanaerobaculia bacterium]